ncbi:MAG: hypothetical protein ACRCSV_01800 [Chlamydiales bacterium]
MKKIIGYLLLVCTAHSTNIYATPKVKVYEVEIVPPLPSYEESEYYRLNQIQRASTSPPCNNKGPCCSSKDQTDCCFRKNRKNTIENQQAYIAIATGILLGIATLGMIFVARDSH